MLIRYLALILACQLVGETISVAADIPVPGPVIGMAILFIGLLIKRGLPAGLEQAGGGLLRHLALLFVPAGVGVMLHGRYFWPSYPAH
jgi:holin-like protein